MIQPFYRGFVFLYALLVGSISIGAIFLTLLLYMIADISGFKLLSLTAHAVDKFFGRALDFLPFPDDL